MTTEAKILTDDMHIAALLAGMDTCTSRVTCP